MPQSKSMRTAPANRRRAASLPLEEPQMETQAKKEKGNVDLVLLLIVALLVILGMLMLFSASYPKALSENQDSYYIIREQGANLLLGVAAAVVVVIMGYDRWRALAWPAMVFALVSLVWVFTMPELNGARRWIILEIPAVGTFTYQPGEVAKFALILVFALMLHGHRNRMHKFQFGVLPFILLLGVVAVLMLAEPHLSGAILIVGIGLVMMYAGGVPNRWMLLIIGAGIGVLLLLWVIRPSFLDHAFLRIETFRDLENADPDASRQTIQSLTAIGSGGVWGRGLGKSRQKYLYLPEMHNDYIFAILCEELGLVGAILVIGLFLALLLRCLMIAYRVKNRFASMLVVGVAAQITLQALLHMAVNANAIPATGISLPFFSYGGTALILQMAEVGLVLSVSRQADLDSREQEIEEEDEDYDEEPAQKPQREPRVNDGRKT